MSKKSRRSRAKHRTTRSRPRAFAVRKVSQVQPVAVSPRQAPVAKPQTTFTQQAERHGQTITELKRISLIAVILLVVLLIVCLLVR